jgi:hypothetical protein
MLTGPINISTAGAAGSSSNEINSTFMAAEDMDAAIFKVFEFVAIRDKNTISDPESQIQFHIVEDLPPPRRFLRKNRRYGSVPRGPTLAKEPHADVCGAGAMTNQNRPFEILQVQEDEEAVVDSSNHDDLFVMLMGWMV